MTNTDRILLEKARDRLHEFIRDEHKAEKEYNELTSISNALATSTDKSVREFAKRLDKIVRGVIHDEIRHAEELIKLL